MAKGIALTIGLNAVDPRHYGGWEGTLNACEADAHDMATLAEAQGFTEVKTLRTREATREAISNEISRAASVLMAGDIFLLTYSGHGGQMPDINGDEPDHLDETMCFFDGEFIDDELDAAFGQFAAGVRILVFSDSCHSGTVIKGAFLHGTQRAGRIRAMPPDVALRTYRNNQAFYDSIQNDPQLQEASRKIKASALLISGCQDNQTSLDGLANGLFTSQLLAVWMQGKFDGDYRQFHEAIVRRMPPEQTPNYYWTGVISSAFENQKPFTV